MKARGAGRKRPSERGDRDRLPLGLELGRELVGHTMLLPRA